MSTSKTKDPGADVGEVDPTGPATKADQPQAAEPGGDSSADAGVYEYNHTSDCIYPQVPLTARAPRPAAPAEGDGPETPAVPATVFEWPFGPPNDGRWTRTRKKPNQAADNEPAPNSEE